MSLLEIRNLAVEFATGRGRFRAVDGVDVTVEEGEILCVVGESGSGKSVAMLAVMGLIAWPGRVTADVMRFAGVDLMGLPARQRRRLIGKDMAMVFQEPMSSLNPCYSVGWQIGEALRVHHAVERARVHDRVVELPHGPNGYSASTQVTLPFTGMSSPQGLALDSARWLVGDIVDRYRVLFADLLDRELARSGGTEVPLSRLLTVASPYLGTGSELAAGTLPIYADLVELRQAIINLLLNAADAMPQGGHLTLKTSRHVELPKMENMKGSAPRLPCVCLTIHPAGCGATMIRDVFSHNTGVLNRCPTPIILRKSAEWQARGYRLTQQASKRM